MSRYIRARAGGLLRGVFAVAEVIGAAKSCAAAAESGRRPSRHDLKVLGLNADAFDHVRFR